MAQKLWIFLCSLSIILLHVIFAEPRTFLDIVHTPDVFYNATFETRNFSGTEYLIILDGSHTDVSSGQHFHTLRNKLKTSSMTNTVTEMFYGPFVSGYCGIFENSLLEFIRSLPGVLSLEVNRHIDLRQKDTHFYHERSSLFASDDSTIEKSGSEVENKLDTAFEEMEGSGFLEGPLPDDPRLDTETSSGPLGTSAAVQWLNRNVALSVKRHPPSFGVQREAPWNLARLSMSKSAMRSLLAGQKVSNMAAASPNQQMLQSSFLFPKYGGKGVTVYVVDTGVAVAHPEFEGRARWGTVVPHNGTLSDIQGHGTHVAGTIAGRTFGVAKQANLVAVKVFEGRGGPVSYVVRGLAWALQDAIDQHQKRQAQLSSKAIKQRQTNIIHALINLSITVPRSASILAIARIAARRGVLIIAAAGNSGVNACSDSFHQEPLVLSVGAYCPDLKVV
jgi:Subtilase family